MPQIPDEYLNVNQRAQLKYSQLKKELKLDVGIPLIENIIEEQTGDRIKIDRQKLQALFNDEIKVIPELEKYRGISTKLENVKKVEKIVEEIDNTFEFIDSLMLPPQLSLAIGLIIAANNTKNRFELIKAIETLQHFDHEKNWKGK